MTYSHVISNRSGGTTSPLSGRYIGRRLSVNGKRDLADLCNNRTQSNDTLPYNVLYPPHTAITVQSI